MKTLKISLILGLLLSISIVSVVFAAQKTITAYGTAQIDTDQSKFGGASGLFNAAANKLTVNPADALAGDFTVDFWFRITTAVNYEMMFQMHSSPFYDIGCKAEGVYFHDGASFAIAATTPPSLDVWHHLALVRSSGTISLYQDGVLVGSYYNATAVNTTDWWIGSDDGSYIRGWMDEIRVSNVARWTADFTPPANRSRRTIGHSLSRPDYFTKLLLHMDGIDASTYFRDDSVSSRN